MNTNQVIKNGLELIVAKAAKHQQPNSVIKNATVSPFYSGKIAYRAGYVHYYCGFSRSFDHFIQVGANVSLAVRRDIFAEVYAMVDKIKGESGLSIYCEETIGSSFCGIGIKIS